MNSNLPIHPLFVHLPIAVAIVIPFVICLVIWGVRKRGMSSRLWFCPVVLQVILFFAIIVAKSFGEDDEEKVEDVVGENVIHEHEEAADRLTIYAGIAGALILATAFVSQKKLRQGLEIASLAASLGTFGFLIPTGHSGAAIIYLHGGGAAYNKGAAPDFGEENKKDSGDELEDEDEAEPVQP